MNNSPLVSIIMNCYNGERFLASAIESVLAQTYSNWELIFWDNVSIDRSAEIVHGYSDDPRIKYHRAEINTPLGRARSLAMEKVQGEFIGFLDVDDLFMPSALERLVGLMHNSDYGLAYGDVQIIDDDGRPLRRRNLRCRSGRVLGQMLRRYEISMVGSMIRRETLRTHGLSFNESFGYGPDYDLFMRIIALGEVGVEPACIAKNRITRGSLTSKSLHLVPLELGYTLSEIERLYPEALKAHAVELKQAKDKIRYYEAINWINQNNYAAARAALRGVRWSRWQFAVIDLLLLLHMPRAWLLQLLNR